MQIISSHSNLDFDGLASVVAATLLYPKAVAVLPRHINPNVKAFLSIHKDLFHFKTSKEIDLDEVTSLIVVDTNRWGRLDGLNSLSERKDLEVILWDHHLPQSGDIVAKEKCQEVTGAVMTLLIREIKEKNIKLTPIFSTLFLAGIYEDTGNLTFSATTSEDVFAAGYLIERKGDLKMVNTFLRPAYGERQKNILFSMLQNAERVKLKGYTVSFNIQHIPGHVDRLSLVVHMYREILNIDAAFGIFLTKPDKCIIIGRSDIDEINVGSIMRSMGGGGHPGAGSSMLKGVNPDAIIEWISELIVGNQQSSVQISDLMSFPVYTVDATTTMRDASLLLEEKGCTGFPVLEDNKLVGVVSRRDFNKVKKQAQLDAPVKAFMVKDVIYVDPEKSPMAAARLMVKHDIGRLPVVDDGQIIGIITRSDAMTYFYDLLPE